ncbi:MAG: hypothetical protein HY926_07645 [Elusimicrobia bacterium]|nr:hypothetical protein [Elusimicrobiota bacterium]
MRIAKPYRLLIPAIAAGVAAGLTLGSAKLLWLAILLFAGAYVTDPLDFWLRRKTKDPIWLMSYEGREWLKTPEGQKWKQETGCKS